VTDFIAQSFNSNDDVKDDISGNWYLVVTDL